MLLEKHATIVVAIILSVFFIISLTVSSQESATTDEMAHIGAAYSYVRYGDMRLNPEHPPFMKDLAGIPLLFLQPAFPLTQAYWADGEEWAVGKAFLYEAGNNADDIIFWARMPIALAAILLGLFIYHWTRQLAGTLAGLFAVTLYAFDPNILAHDHLVTTDMGIATFLFMATYYFVRFLKEPNWKNTILFGIFLGVVQMVKFSAVILFPFFALLAIVYASARALRPNEFPTSSARGRRWVLIFSYIWKYSVAVILCFMAICILYFFNTLNMPMEKIGAIANGLFERMHYVSVGDSPVAHMIKAVIDWMMGMPLLKPLTLYILGVSMVFVRVAELGSRYFLGTLIIQAKPEYFPVVFLLKETLPFLFLLFASIIYALSRLFVSLTDKTRAFGKKYVSFIEHKIAQIAMMGFVVFYCYLCITGSLNLGFRHLFPILPFLYVLTATTCSDALHRLREQFLAHAWVINSLAGLFVFWIVSIPVLAYPSYISYFNEAAGGHANGYQYVTDSNYDWGQDLKNLKKWVGQYNECLSRQDSDETQPCGLDYRRPTETPIEKIHIHYFGGSDPKYYFGDNFILWHDSFKPEPGWYAISAQYYQESTHKPFKPDTWNYRWLQNYPMISRAGDSIFIFHVPDDSNLPVSPNAYRRDSQ
ncbi:MAG: ArnT family glycosyltransferase [Candidatus Methylumidiphilus sp.]